MASPPWPSRCFAARGISSITIISYWPQPRTIFYSSSPSTSYEEVYVSTIQLFRSSITRRPKSRRSSERGCIEGHSEEESKGQRSCCLGRDGCPKGSWPPQYCPCFPASLSRAGLTSEINAGQVLRMVWVTIKVLSCFWASCRRRTLWPYTAKRKIYWEGRRCSHQVCFTNYILFTIWRIVLDPSCQEWSTCTIMTSCIGTWSMFCSEEVGPLI